MDTTLLDSLQLAPAATKFLQGLFGESPEDAYNRARRENLKAVINSIRTNISTQQGRLSRSLQRGSALARQRGARQAASLGYSGSPDAFSTPEVSALEGGYMEGMTRLGEAETEQLAQAETAFPQAPSYSFPTTLDYLGQGLGIAGQFLSDRELMELERQRIAKLYPDFEKTTPGARFGYDAPPVQYSPYVGSAWDEVMR